MALTLKYNFSFKHSFWRGGGRLKIPKLQPHHPERFGATQHPDHYRTLKNDINHDDDDDNRSRIHALIGRFLEIYSVAAKNMNTNFIKK